MINSSLSAHKVYKGLRYYSLVIIIIFQESIYSSDGILIYIYDTIPIRDNVIVRFPSGTYILLSVLHLFNLSREVSTKNPLTLS